MRLLFHWLVISAVILGAPHLLPGITVEGVRVAVVIAFVLGLANAIIRPKIERFTCPVKIVSKGLQTAFEPRSFQPLRKGLIGLLTVAINAFILLVSSMFVPGFAVAELKWALFLSLLLSAIGWLFKKSLKCPT